jgi:hypothetical protein
MKRRKTQMTLNITVLSASGIHQSADFQLSELEKDADGNWKPLEPNASKIVALRFQHWSGLLTYCGMGKWRDVRTDKYVSDWLSRIDKDASFDDVVEVVRKESSFWIKRINESIKRLQLHTFVLAGFENNKLRRAVVSNYQTSTTEFAPLRDWMRADSRSAAGVHVYVTGIRDAVTKADRRCLKRLVKTGKHHEEIRYQLAVINRRAAKSKAAKNGTGEPCLISTSVSSGKQWASVYGTVVKPVMPLAVDGAGNIHDKMLNKILKDLLPNASLVQSVYFTPRELQEQNEKTIACQLRFKSVFSEPDRVAIAEVQELGLTKELILDIRAVNRSQAIAGHAHILPDATPMAFFMSADRKVLLLNSLHGRLGYAHGINEASQVVGRASVAGGAL